MLYNIHKKLKYFKIVLLFDNCQIIVLKQAIIDMFLGTGKDYSVSSW